MALENLVDTFIKESNCRINDIEKGISSSANRRLKKILRVKDEILKKHGVDVFLSILDDNNYDINTKFHAALSIKELCPETALKYLTDIRKERGVLGALSFVIISTMKKI